MKKQKLTSGFTVLIMCSFRGRQIKTGVPIRRTPVAYPLLIDLFFKGVEF